MTKQEVLDAIDASLVHWQRMRRDPLGCGEKPFGSECALCNLTGDNCLVCPLYYEMGMACDEGDTVWKRAVRAVVYADGDWTLDDMVEWRERAADMLDALVAASRRVEAGEFDFISG